MTRLEEYRLYRRIRDIIDDGPDRQLHLGTALSFHIWQVVHSGWGKARTFGFVLSSILRLLIFTPKLVWLRRDSVQSPRTLLLHGAFDRPDHNATFRQVMQLGLNLDALDFRGWALSANSLGLIFILTRWIPEASQLPEQLRLDQRLYLACLRGQLEKFAAALCATLSPQKYHHVVAFTDALPFPNIAIQTAKTRGIQTSALQHGQIVVYAEDDPHINMINYEAFVSDHYLIWGEYTKRELLRKIPDNRLRIMGHPKYVGFSQVSVLTTRKRRKPTQIFGIAFEQEVYIASNREMLRIAEECANLFDFRYIVKMHPNNSRSDYADFGQLPNCDGFHALDISMDDFAAKIDFCIARTSTAYNEMLLRFVPTFRLRDSGYYSMVDYPDEFTNTTELQLLWQHFMRNPEVAYRDMMRLANFFFFGLDGTSENLYRNYLEHPPMKASSEPTDARREV